jgi:hypothetical protein
MPAHIDLGSGEKISRLNVLSKGLSFNHLIYCYFSAGYIISHDVTSRAELGKCQTEN